VKFLRDGFFIGGMAQISEGFRFSAFQLPERLQNRISTMDNIAGGRHGGAARPGPIRVGRQLRGQIPDIAGQSRRRGIKKNEKKQLPSGYYEPSLDTFPIEAGGNLGGRIEGFVK